MAARSRASGSWTSFEGADARFSRSSGVGLHVLDPASRWRCTTAEDDQEDFLVVAGEALLVIEGRGAPAAARGTSSTARRGLST